LDNVRILENLNTSLLQEVERARLAYQPKVMDKTDLDKQLNKLRTDLEDRSYDVVKIELDMDNNQSLSQHITQRLRFFQIEEEISKQKIANLKIQLDEISRQKDYILRGAQVQEEEIKRDQNQIFKTEKDLEELRKKLKEGRLENKKAEFEMQTLLDQLAFLRAVFNEEINVMKSNQNSMVLPGGGDVTAFYKNELITAVRQIREDFHTLNKQQLDEYKSRKEAELAEAQFKVEQDEIFLKQQRSKMSANQDLESQNSKVISFILIIIIIQY
jgi:hypothetical protein